jgi:DNA repair protein RecN (Recombination protein N)
MLAELRIRNYALIDDLRIELHPGFNVLTGETGAGKSIVLGAMSLVLGDRPDTDMIRTGAQRAEVEARFEDPVSVNEECNRMGIEMDQGDLILRRRAERTGKNSALANDSSITVAGMRALGDRLVDLHGQHQHQLLLKPDVHLEILDAYAGLSAQRSRLAEDYLRHQDLKKQLAELEQEIAARREHRELIEYQLKELADAAVSEGELEELHREKELLESAEKRYRLAQEIVELLSEQEGSAIELLEACSHRLAELGRLDENLGPEKQHLGEAQSLLDDVWRRIVGYRDAIQFSPDRLEEVNNRLFLLEKLGRKHQVPPDELPGLAQGLQAELDDIGLYAERRDELRSRLAALEAGLLSQAGALSIKRSAAKKRLEARMKTEFKALGLESAQLVVQITRPDDLTAANLERTGFDRVELLFSGNPGEEIRPLRKVASGGELSRIMLGLKNTLARVNLVPTMVFDEVDVGIGGRVAESVGRRLARLGKTQQVVCITHLPQIAKYADRHFLVTKSTGKGRTTTSIRTLDHEERVQELARMSAGTDVTATGLAHAREMLERNAG